MKLEMFWNLIRKIYLKGLDPTLQSFSMVPHCHWKTRVGTGTKGTGPEDYVAVNWLRSNGEKVAILQFDPKQLISESAYGFFTATLLVSSDKTGSGKGVYSG